MTPDFETQFDRYAQLAIQLGVNLQPGQRLLVRAPVAAAPFVRRLAAEGYRSGSPLVDVIWSDEGVDRARYRHGLDGSFAELAPWRTDAHIAAAERGDAILSVLADDPSAYAGLDDERIAAARIARQHAMRPFSEKTMSDEVAWSIVAVPVPAWAQAVFPEAEPEVALERLWRSVLAVVRADRADAGAAWREHIARLAGWSERLNERGYRTLHFRGPGTDLRVGLADGHRWEGGASRTPSGQAFVPNLPTEEVFTAPHRERVDGVVTSSRPLAYNGQLIEDFSLTFEAGRVVEAEARSGGASLRAILDTDEGASRLGEVALVPADGPIARAGILFLETLLDENAASHLALGRAYPTNLEGGRELGAEAVRAAGLNDSITHVDFMIGSAAMDVDGLDADGGREPVMRAGAWST